MRLHDTFGDVVLVSDREHFPFTYRLTDKVTAFLNLNKFVWIK
jgi:hypothetical protein